MYVLKLSNKQIYTGYTSDVKRRLKEHKDGKVKSTTKRRPLKLIHLEIYLLESDAKRREKYLKTTEGKYFLKQQLKDLFNKIGK